VFDEFLSEQEEREVLRELDDDIDVGSGANGIPPSSAASSSWKSERHTGVHREKRYGVDHDLWSRSIRAPVRPLPPFVDRLLVPRFGRVRELRARRFRPDEGNAIEYRRGCWLEPHVDDRAKHREAIANLSLAGDCVMTFAPLAAPAPPPPPGGGGGRGGEVRVLLRRRALAVLTGSARYRYAHGIRKEDLLSDRRVSFTLRETA
jgi:alkylated DNA repair dioxygenase AlkB